MAEIALEARAWAEQQFGACELGDQRRTERAVKYAAAVADHPDGSTPDQTESWSDCKAAYRLFDSPRATFRALAEPHWRATRQQAHGVCLVLGDTTEIDFSGHRKTTGLGPIGNGGCRGFLLHSALVVQADTGEILGLAGQELFCRQAKPPRENNYRRTQRPRESEVWGRVIDEVGPPPEAARFLHMLHRGADNLEVFCHLQQQGCGWVVRAAHLTRIVENAAGKRQSLRAVLAAQTPLGTYQQHLSPRGDQPQRIATLEVRAAQVTLLTPRRATPYLRSLGRPRVTQWVVEAREIDPPPGVTPLHWVLYTSEPVRTLEDALRIIGYYESRWLIEEYHKCLKTSCRVEDRHYTTAQRLQAVIGLLGVVAVRLLQFKRVAQADPDAPAEQVAPKAWVDMLRRICPRARLVTAREFFRGLAQLGGFLARKGDGEPGWITLWRGHTKLQLLLRGAAAARIKCG